APGKERGEVGQGLNPRPPSLSDAAPGWTPSELFWIVKNGIRMTGMPALGPTHEDDRIWAIISFVEQLPSMTPAEYQQRQSPSPRGAPHPHEHHGDHHEHAHRPFLESSEFAMKGLSDDRPCGLGFICNVD